jgi:type III pantothenate kinase
MTLLIDSGNTRVKLAWIDAKSVVLTEITALAYADPEFESRLADVLNKSHHSKHCFWASVVANAWSEKIRHQLLLSGFDITQVKAEKQALGVEFAYLQPSRLGVDRFLGMIAAHHFVKKTILVVSVGTAVTIDLLDSLGQHHGGVIAAGESFVAQVMSEHFPVFKNLNGQASGFSNTTDNALATGLRWMQLGVIEKALQQAKAEIKVFAGNDVSLLLCGGGAESLLNDLPAQTLYRPHLVLEGLALWAQAHS